MTHRIVVLDDEPNMGKILRKHLLLEGYDVEAFEDPRPALEHLRRNRIDVLISDLRMPGISGEEILETVRRENLGCDVILMTAYGTVESAMRCVRNGAYDYVTKPFDTKALLGAVRGAITRREKDSSTPAPATVPAPPAPVGHDSSSHEILGKSPEIQGVRDLITRIAPSDSAVLIYGESGTGKELAARAIHRQSRRATRRFMPVNCASIPENLMESELFGHEKGAFTGAHEVKIGIIEAASGGTLFLDEIGELPLALQAKLLRVLQEREINRVGSVDQIPVDVRVIAATNRKLETAVEAGQFREDLYYRLNVLKIKMPPLRQRAGDVELLARHFFALFCERAGKEGMQLAPIIIERLNQMPWPGNIRELRNYMERLTVLGDGPVLGEEVLADLAMFESQVMPVTTPIPSTLGMDSDSIVDYRKARDDFEKDYLTKVLASCGGNVTEAARIAGISRRSFYEKVEKLEIDLSIYKDG